MLSPWDRKLADTLEFSPDWDAETLCAEALQLLRDWFGFVPGQEQPQKRKRKRGLFVRRRGGDGLALRALCQEMEAAPCEHKIVILLSDARPNDIVQFSWSGRYVDYAGENGIMNTAAEVRSLLHSGIAVICVFTGEDEDVPSAHTIYGRDFARIRHPEQFADTVGTLIQNQIRSF